MTFMILTAGEVDLLKQLSTAGEHGRAIGILKGTELQRLVRMGFVAGDTAKYRITKWGEEALSDACAFRSQNQRQSSWE